NELSQDQVEPASRILRRKIRNRRLVSNDERQLRDEIGNQTTVQTERFTQRIAPRRQIRFALAQQPSDEARKCLRECGVGNVAPVLIELPRREESSRRDEGLVELVDHRRLADA